jgi:hypothetical protein
VANQYEGITSDGLRLIRNNLPSGLPLPPTVSINLGPEVKAAYEPFVDAHGIIIRKLEGHIGTGSNAITSSTGGSFDAFDMQERMIGVDYKLRYAAVSLNKLETVYDQQIAAVKETGDYLGDKTPLTEDVVFNADVFFTFISSSMDLASWVVHLAHGTTLTSNYVYLKKVAENLASRSGGTYNLFRTLGTEIESGWISKFEDYRNYVTHHGRLHTGRSMSFRQGEVRVGVILLPDDPRARPTTFRQEVELVPYAKDSMVKALGVIKDLYSFAASLI